MKLMFSFSTRNVLSHQLEKLELSSMWNSHRRTQDLAGGGARFFLRLGKLDVIKRHLAQGEAMRIARGFGGMLPRDFFKWCNLVRFGVYLDQILF